MNNSALWRIKTPAKVAPLHEQMLAGVLAYAETPATVALLHEEMFPGVLACAETPAKVAPLHKQMLAGVLTAPKRRVSKLRYINRCSPAFSPPRIT